MDGLKRFFARTDSLKLAALAVLVGVCLLLIPGRSEKTQTLTEQQQLCALLSGIEGVGRAELMLSDSGAVVVCEGAQDALVRLDICRALQCYTGLGADRIRVFQGKFD